MASEDKGYVIFHSKMGIFLGEVLGMGFWSRMDPCGLDEAVLFKTDDEAIEYSKQISGFSPEDFTFVRVQDDRDGCASIDACVQAGLQGWVA